MHTHATLLLDTLVCHLSLKICKESWRSTAQTRPAVRSEGRPSLKISASSEGFLLEKVPDHCSRILLFAVYCIIHLAHVVRHDTAGKTLKCAPGLGNSTE